MFDKITALYCRYSRDDGQEEENASITHQRELLKEYAENNGYTNLRCYADDGYSGTNFNRPDFQRMLGDIPKGLVSTIIVKDISRLGRNYLMVGQYVEINFHTKGGRYIAINDHVDTNNGECGLAPFLTIRSEIHARQTGREVPAVMHRRCAIEADCGA